MEDFKSYYGDNVGDFSFREHLIKDIFLQKKSFLFSFLKSNNSLFQESVLEADTFLKSMYDNLEKGK